MRTTLPIKFYDFALCIKRWLLRYFVLTFFLSRDLFQEKITSWFQYNQFKISVWRRDLLYWDICIYTDTVFHNVSVTWWVPFLLSAIVEIEHPRLFVPILLQKMSLTTKAKNVGKKMATRSVCKKADYSSSPLPTGVN